MMKNSRFDIFLQAHRRPATFAVVGVINTAVDFCVFSIVYAAFPVSAAAAQMAGYTAGLICSFLLNKYVTFKNNAKDFRQVLLFLLCNGIALVVSMAAIHLLHDVLGIEGHVAKIFMVTPLTMIMNYFGYKHVVFR